MGLSASKQAQEVEKSIPSSQRRSVDKEKKVFDSTVPRAQTEKPVKDIKREEIPKVPSPLESPQIQDPVAIENKKAVQFTVMNQGFSEGPVLLPRFTRPKPKKVTGGPKKTLTQAKPITQTKEESTSTAGEEKLDYVFLLEKVKELTETVKDMNDRVSKLETSSQTPKIIPQPNLNTELKPTSFAPIMPPSSLPAQTGPQPGLKTDPEELIKRMRSQLKKREPVVSFLNEQRALYKKKKLAQKAAEQNSSLGNLV